jgi:hypothetical protein
MSNEKAFLVVSGAMVGKGKNVSVDASPDVHGRRFAHAAFDVEVQATFVIDEDALQAVHSPADFGFEHLRAMLDALPRCGAWVLPEGVELGMACGSCATRARTFEPPSGEMRLEYFCDEHAMTADPATGWSEIEPLPSAPAVRHIERWVVGWEKGKACLESKTEEAVATAAKVA